MSKEEYRRLVDLLYTTYFVVGGKFDPITLQEKDITTISEERDKITNDVKLFLSTWIPKHFKINEQNELEMRRID